MTVYYVSPSGSDANNGLGPDASHASNKPWVSLGKALGAAGIASGDTVYVGPGTYREVLTLALASPTVTTSVLADPGNAQGFKDSGAVLLAAAPVVWTAYLTNDTTAPSASSIMNLNGRDFLLFDGFLFIGGGGTIITGTTTNSTDITYRNCTFLGSGLFSGITYTGLADIASNWTISRCVLFGATGISITLPTSASADYDSNFQIVNCLFLGSPSSAVTIATSGAGAFKGGGVDVLNCTFLGKGASLATTSANVSTTIPCTIYNCITYTSSAALNANTAGQIVEDYNYIVSGTPRTNVSVGAASITGNPPADAFLVEVGQGVLQGRAVRSFLTPMLGSPLLGFGNQAGAPTVDFLNRPRPAGGASINNGLGYLERHETGVKETSTVRTGSAALVLGGPADHEFDVPVDAVSTTLSIYGRYDTNHATTNKPQMLVVNGGECGVADATATMTVGVDTWEQLSLNFTPARAGIVTIRLVSRAAAGNGKAFFDDFAVT